VDRPLASWRRDVQRTHANDNTHYLGR